jgi:hypothetical protein
MKLGTWRFGKHKATPASHFVSVLDRVREMREHSAWEPATSPNTIQQRSDRVAVAREHITIPPLAGEHGVETFNRGKRSPWLESYRPFLYGVLASAIVFALMLHLPPRAKPARFVKINIETSTIAFPLPDSYPYASLTDNQAENFARKALRSTGLDSSAWWVDINPENGLQLRRIRSYGGNFEGIIVFRHRRDFSFSESVRVNVKLEFEEKRIVCTIDP